MRTCYAVVLLAAAVVPAAAQTASTPVIANTGEATVYAHPIYADFWLHLDTTGDTMETAMAASEDFPARLRDLLQAKDLHVSDFEVTHPAIMSLDDNRVRTSARLRFPMGSFAKPDTGPKMYGRLCDTVRGVAQTLNCDLVGPLLEPGDRAEVRKSAISAATENAYAPAAAVATALKSEIFAVDSVEILEIRWNMPEETGVPGENIRQVSCIARVRVVYQVSGKQ